MATNYDYVVIDGAPSGGMREVHQWKTFDFQYLQQFETPVSFTHLTTRVSDLARSGTLAADLVVIPVQSSAYDIWAATETVTLIEEASVFKETLKSVFVINRKIVNTPIARDLAEAIQCHQT